MSAGTSRLDCEAVVSRRGCIYPGWIEQDAEPLILAYGRGELPEFRQRRKRSSTSCLVIMW
jgi:hypothetical protein